MNRFSIFFLAFILPGLAFSQLKSQAELPNISEAIAKPASGIFFGFFNPERFHMHHTFSASYLTGGGNGMMVNSYMNTMDYRFSNLFFMRLNLGLMYSPYNSFTNNPAMNNTRFFGSAEFQYRPADNMTVQFGVAVPPPYYDYRYSPFLFGR